MMYVNFNLTKAQLNKLQKFKNPVLRLERNMTNKDGKYVIPMSVALFNKLIRQGYVNYKFTDVRKNKIIQEGGSLASLFKSIIPYVAPIAKKILPAIGLSAAATLTSEGIKKGFNKGKKGRGITIDIDSKTKRDIENLYKVLKNDNVVLNHQNGGSILSFLIPLAASIIPSLINKGSGLQIIKQDF